MGVHRGLDIDICLGSYEVSHLLFSFGLQNVWEGLNVIHADLWSVFLSKTHRV